VADIQRWFNVELERDVRHVGQARDGEAKLDDIKSLGLWSPSLRRISLHRVMVFHAPKLTTATTLVHEMIHTLVRTNPGDDPHKTWWQQLMLAAGINPADH
jgi:hypothetical protein